MKRSLLILLAGFLAWSWGGPLAAAEKYPSKPITFVVPWGPGGMSDVSGRLLAEKFKVELGQPVLVVNKPGASGILGLKYALSQKADGYTAAIGPLTDALVSPYFQGAEAFHIGDISYVAAYMPQQRVLYAAADKPYKAFPEFVEYAKKNPDKIKWGHTGRGAKLWIIGSIFAETAGIKLIDVPAQAVMRTAEAKDSAPNQSSARFYRIVT